MKLPPKIKLVVHYYELSTIKYITDMKHAPFNIVVHRNKLKFVNGMSLHPNHSYNSNRNF